MKYKTEQWKMAKNGKWPLKKVPFKAIPTVYLDVKKTLLALNWPSTLEKVHCIPSFFLTDSFMFNPLWNLLSCNRGQLP